MLIRPLSRRLRKYVRTRGLDARFTKQKALFEEDLRHPSLHTELLEPRHMGIYSFRVTRKHRALFVVDEHGVAEIIDLNDHYE